MRVVERLTGMRGYSFRKYCEEFFKKTVFTLPCRSWYKRGTENGPVTALWPGSSLHFVKVLERPRFEDYDYTYPNGNDIGWIGNSLTVAEDDENLDVTEYLNPDSVDFPSY